MSDNDAVIAVLGKQAAIDLEQMTVDDHDDDWGESMLWMYNHIRRLARELAAERQVAPMRALGALPVEPEGWVPYADGSFPTEDVEYDVTVQHERDDIPHVIVACYDGEWKDDHGAVEAQGWKVLAYRRRPTPYSPAAQPEPMAAADPPPVSAIEIRLSIGAESEDRLIEVVEDMTRRWRTEGGVGTSLWGGAGSHGHIDVARRDISPDDYRAELGAWFERERARKAAGGAT